MDTADKSHPSYFEPDDKRAKEIGDLMAAFYEHLPHRFELLERHSKFEDVKVDVFKGSENVWVIPSVHEHFHTRCVCVCVCLCVCVCVRVCVCVCN